MLGLSERICEKFVTQCSANGSTTIHQYLLSWCSPRHISAKDSRAGVHFQSASYSPAWIQYSWNNTIEAVMVYAAGLAIWFAWPSAEWKCRASCPRLDKNFKMMTAEHWSQAQGPVWLPRLCTIKLTLPQTSYCALNVIGIHKHLLIMNIFKPQWAGLISLNEFRCDENNNNNINWVMC